MIVPHLTTIITGAKSTWPVSAIISTAEIGYEGIVNFIFGKGCLVRAPVPGCNRQPWVPQALLHIPSGAQEATQDPPR